MDDNQINQRIDYINQEVENYLKRFKKGASRNQRRTRIGKLAIIISTWIATSLIGLINFQLPPNWEVGLKIAAFIFSAISTGATTSMQAGDFEERGKKYSLKASNTEMERFRFNAGAGEYKGKSMSDKVDIFATNLEIIWTDGATKIDNPTHRTEKTLSIEK
jgi:hypothetical protein